MALSSQPSSYLNGGSNTGATSSSQTDSHASGHAGSSHGSSDSYVGIDSYKPPPSGQNIAQQFQDAPFIRVE